MCCRRLAHATDLLCNCKAYEVVERCAVCMGNVLRFFTYGKWKAKQEGLLTARLLVHFDGPLSNRGNCSTLG